MSKSLNTGIDVSVIIVNYKTPVLLRECISSIYANSKGENFEIIIVDNHSQDDSESIIIGQFPNIIWNNIKENVGFGKANNIGSDLANGKYLLFLNSDTVLRENSIKHLLDYYKSSESKNQRIGLVTPKVQFPNGTLQKTCYYSWFNLREIIEGHPFGILLLQRLLRVKKIKAFDRTKFLNTNHRPTWIGMPIALINSKTFQKFRFDENFFLYSEDEELNFRLNKAGYSPHFLASTYIIHTDGGSSLNSALREKQIFASKLLFLRKSRSRVYYKICMFILKSTYKWNSKLNRSTLESNIDLNFVEEVLPKIEKCIKSEKQLNLYSDGI